MKDALRYGVRTANKRRKRDLTRLSDAPSGGICPQGREMCGERLFVPYVYRIGKVHVLYSNRASTVAVRSKTPLRASLRARKTGPLGNT